MREVFIEGIPMDVTESEAVDIIFESPIFTDISKIKSNTTTTYKLPKTERNLAIFKNSDQFDVVQSARFPYTEHEFSEYRNGLPIIRNGRCRLLTISNSIELAVVWGTKVSMTELLKYKLSELSKFGAAEKYVRWDDNAKFLEVESKSNYGFIYADFGQGLPQEVDDNGKPILIAKRYQYTHPSMNITGIIDAINEVTEAPIRLPEDSPMKKVFDKTWVPCLSKFADETVFEEGTLDLKFRTLKGNRQTVSFDKPKSDPFKLFHDDGDYNEIYLKKSTIKMKLSGTVTFEGDYKAHKYVGICISTNHRYSETTYHKADVQAEIIHDPLSAKSVATFDIDVTFTIEATDETISTNAGKKASLSVLLYKADRNGRFGGQLYFNTDLTPSHPNFKNYPQVGVSGHLLYSGAEVDYGLNFPILRNLPDMTCSDFLKSVFGMYGLYPWVKTEQEAIGEGKGVSIELLSVNDIYNSIDFAKDWSHKQLEGDVSIERTFQEYGQRNILRYQIDEEVGTISEGVIKVDNDTLPAEKEILQLKFSATDMKGDVSYLPIYVTSMDNNKNIDFNSISPRILAEGDRDVETGQSSQGFRTLVFNKELRFEGLLLEEYYNSYRKVLVTPTILNLVIQLSEIDVYSLSGKDIIYFRGCYWMPIRIQVSVNGKASCKFILLPDVLTNESAS